MNRPRLDGGEISAESVTTPAITMPSPKPQVNLSMHNLQSVELKAYTSQFHNSRMKRNNEKMMNTKQLTR